ncbi:MAG: hypothetical protein NWS95_07415, partial [Schleiferiaceae bacterium]|nr:hypothetical protein [Schleiferiaceae bacterium]
THNPLVGGSNPSWPTPFVLTPGISAWGFFELGKFKSNPRPGQTFAGTLRICAEKVPVRSKLHGIFQLISHILF